MKPLKRACCRTINSWPPCTDRLAAPASAKGTCQLLRRKWSQRKTKPVMRTRTRGWSVGNQPYVQIYTGVNMLSAKWGAANSSGRTGFGGIAGQSCCIPSRQVQMATSGLNTPQGPRSLCVCVGVCARAPLKWGAAACGGWNEKKRSSGCPTANRRFLLHVPFIPAFLSLAYGKVLLSPSLPRIVQIFLIYKNEEMSEGHLSVSRFKLSLRKRLKAFILSELIYSYFLLFRQIKT